jgi:hypothetical protein
MFELRDLMSWDKFITPALIKTFYTLAVGFSIALGLLGILSGLSAMGLNPFVGLLTIIVSIIGTIFAVVGFRVVAEAILIAFRINEHLGVIRGQYDR